MLIGVTNQEFLQHNSNRSYPLSEQTTKLSGEGFTIPNNFLVAAKIVVNATPEQVNISNFYIGRLIVYNGGIRIDICYQDNNKSIRVGVVTAADTDRYNVTFPIIGVHTKDFLHGLAGHITIGTFDQIKYNLGDYPFDVVGGRFDVDVVQYSTAAVTSVTVEANGITYQPIRGDIKIVAGKNINIHPESEEGHTVLRISRQSSDTELRCRCIKTINEVTPDKDGNIELVSASPCLKITEETAKLNITETCCEPCCECEELAMITNGIQSLVQAHTDIRLYQHKLEQQLQQLTTTLSITGV